MAAPESEAFVREELEPHRRSIVAHCYRMLGSLSDAEDLAQESLVRGWQKRAERSAESSTRAWLYAIATRACLDSLRRRKRRQSRAEIVGSHELETYAHVGPFPDSLLGPEHELSTRQSIKLAFIAALQLLPAKQRAALLLVDVLGWSPVDAANALKTSQAALNSLLQRARRSAGERRQASHGSAVDDHAALERFIAAWQSGDPDGLAAILAADAQLAMPPGAEVYVGREAITRFLRPVVHQAPGLYRLVPVAVNNSAGAAIYRKGDGESFVPSGVSVLEIEAGLVTQIVRFDASAELFARFGLSPSAPGA